jgi:hypothetical protein
LNIYTYIYGLDKEMNKKLSNVFTPCYQMKFLFFKTWIFFGTKSQKYKKDHVLKLFHKKPTSLNLKKTIIYLFILIYNFLTLGTKCIIIVDVSLRIIKNYNHVSHVFAYLVQI